MRKTGPLCRTFPVWPERARSKDFYRVRIFATRELMHEYLKLAAGGRVDPRCEASARGMKVYQLARGKWTRVNRVGEVCFYAGRCGAGIVAHEMTHAASYWLCNHRRVKPQIPSVGNSPRRGFDERQAYAVGEMVKQFYRAFYRVTDAREPRPARPIGRAA